MRWLTLSNAFCQGNKGKEEASLDTFPTVYCGEQIATDCKGTLNFEAVKK